MSADLVDCTIADIAAPIKNALVGGPFGSNLVSKDYVDSGVPVIRGQNMGHGRMVSGEFVFVSPQKANDLSANTARPGDLIFTQRGTLGQVAIVPDGPYDKYIVSQSQMKLTVDPKKADTQFLYYLFCSPEQQNYIKTNAIQAGVPHTNLGILRGTPIALPPIENQRDVAKILGSLDDKIELNRQINQTLEQIAQTLFKSWFVDFEPAKAKIEAKAAGRDPERAAMCAISGKLEHELDQLPPEQRQQLAATAALFPDELVKSELGLIPVGWEADSVYRVSDMIYGAPFASAKFNTDGVGKPLIRIRDLKDEAPGVFTPENHPKGYVVKPGDIVVGMDGEFRAYLWGGEEAWLNQRVCVFKPKKAISTAFVRSSIIPSLAAVEASETATTVIHLGKNDIDRFRIINPKPEVMAAFGSVADSIYNQIVSLKQSSRTLTTLRDTLLPKLLSGEIEVNTGTGE